MAARSVGLWVMRREVQRSSFPFRRWSSKTVFWFWARRSARWERVWRRISTLRIAKALATAASVTSVPKRTSFVPRRAAGSLGAGLPARESGREAAGLFTDGFVPKRDVEFHFSRFPGPYDDLTPDGAGPLVPGVDGVGSGRDVADLEGTTGIRRREEGTIQDDDHRAHVGVDVAEHPDHPRLFEPDEPRGSARVAPQVERRGLREREHVVIDRIHVGKLHGGPFEDWQNMGDEALVALLHPQRPCRRGSLARRGAVGLQVDDHVRDFLLVLERARIRSGMEIRVKAEVDLAGVQFRTHRHGASERTGSRRSPEGTGCLRPAWREGGCERQKNDRRDCDDGSHALSSGSPREFSISSHDSPSHTHPGRERQLQQRNIVPRGVISMATPTPPQESIRS